MNKENKMNFNTLLNMAQNDNLSVYASDRIADSVRRMAEYEIQKLDDILRDLNGEIREANMYLTDNVTTISGTSIILSKSEKAKVKRELRAIEKMKKQIEGALESKKAALEEIKKVSDLLSEKRFGR